jgi:1,4-dihydroxy-2-naphthoate octaprenyltransferase
MSRWSAWIQASRPPSQLYIFLPLLAGQSFCVLKGHVLDGAGFVLIHLFGLFIQLFIVYANDVGDRDTDRLNRTHTIFSGGSRVLAEEKITLVSLKRASVLMAALTMAIALVTALLLERYLTLALGGVGLALLYMYSFSPFRISYGGGGELLQAIGVGLILPMYGYYGQCGGLTGFPLELLAVMLPTALACAMATALPDEPSDRSSKKRTAVVLFGNRIAQLTIIVLNTVSIVAFFVIFNRRLQPGAMLLLVALPIAATLVLAFRRGGSPGERRLSVFVGVAITATLTLFGALCALPLASGR